MACPARAFPATGLLSRDWETSEMRRRRRRRKRSMIARTVYSKHASVRESSSTPNPRMALTRTLPTFYTIWYEYVAEE